LNPTWDKEMRFLVEKAKKYQKLEVQVYDHDKVGKNDLLGVAVVDFAHLVGEGDSEPWEVTAPLTGKGSEPNSTVSLKLTYIAD